MRHIKPGSLGVSLVVFLPLLWKGITSQVIYLPGYSIRVSPSVRVQEGLCVTIPCTFTADNTNRFRNSFGYWIRVTRDSAYIAATNDKSSDVNKPNFNLTGNPDTGDCTLTITGARKEDAGEYYFRFEKSKYDRVRYGYNRETTTTITVKDFTEKPVISDLGTLTAGIDKTVTCAPPGNCSVTSLVIQWKKSDVSGIWKNSSTITLTPSPDDHQKNITCEVTNSRGKTTRRSILLDVFCPASFTVTSEINGKKDNKSHIIKVTEGSSVILRCSVQSNLTLNVAWTDEKNNVLQNGTEKDLELRLENMMGSHTGTYTCSALNECVRNSTNVNITVLYSPRNMEITIHSANGEEHPASSQVYINPNDTLTLVCSADGDPPSTVVWIRGKDEGNTSIMSNRRFSTEINVNFSMADVYRCSAWNALGLRERLIKINTKQDNSGSASVEKPIGRISVTITSEINGEERPASPQVDINPTETLTLMCRAEGNPPVTAVWVRGEEDVDTYNISKNGLSAVINVTSSEADVYRCFAWNGFGLRERRIQVGTKGVCMASSPSTIIIGTVIGNIVLLITVIVGSYFFMKRRMEKRQLGGRSPDPGAQEPESTYQELKGQKDDVYHNLKVQ